MLRALGAAPYERSDERLGYANGYKPKAVATRLGAVRFDIPQVRGDGELSFIHLRSNADCGANGH